MFVCLSIRNILCLYASFSTIVSIFAHHHHTQLDMIRHLASVILFSNISSTMSSSVPMIGTWNVFPHFDKLITNFFAGRKFSAHRGLPLERAGRTTKGKSAPRAARGELSPLFKTSVRKVLKNKNIFDWPRHPISSDLLVCFFLDFRDNTTDFFVLHTGIPLSVIG